MILQLSLRLHKSVASCSFVTKPALAKASRLLKMVSYNLTLESSYQAADSIFKIGATMMTFLQRRLSTREALFQDKIP